MIYAAHNGPGPWPCGKCSCLIEMTDDFQIDHIDGDHSNDDPTNLQVLHPACHASKTSRDTWRVHGDRMRAIASAMGTRTCKVLNSRKAACPECGRVCGNIGALMVHRKNRHLGSGKGNPIDVCPECGREVQRGAPMAQHRRRHGIGARAYMREICPICGRSFTLQNIKRHLQSQHTGVQAREKSRLAP